MATITPDSAGSGRSVLTLDNVEAAALAFTDLPGGQGTSVGTGNLTAVIIDVPDWHDAGDTQGEMGAPDGGGCARLTTCSATYASMTSGVRLSPIGMAGGVARLRVATVRPLASR